MLWYKGWLETRFRLLMMLVLMGSFLFMLYWSRNAAPEPGARAPVVGFVLFTTPAFVIMICVMLAGAGIATQPTVQATKGLHGSTLFTLSLPVSRLRLLAIRAAIGFLGAVLVIGTACFGMWLLSEPLRSIATPIEMFEYGATLIACASALYSLSVLLATFLDDVWRTWGTMMAGVALWALPNLTPLPAFADIFRAMGEGSPVIAHTTPWPAMAFSLGLAATLFFAALKVAQSREY